MPFVPRAQAAAEKDTTTLSAPVDRVVQQSPPLTKTGPGATGSQQPGFVSGGTPPLTKAGPGGATESQEDAGSSGQARTTDNTGAKVTELYRQAAERYASMDSYIARMRRREQVNGKDNPEEVLLFKFRKQPCSVYLKWLGAQSKGREVVYVKGRYEDKIHTYLADGDMPFAPAGKIIALPPDSIFVRSSSRHTITDAGIGSILDKFGKLAAQAQRGGNLKYLGLQLRPEYDTPLESVEQSIAPGQETLLPRGGRRQWYFDPASKLPVLVITWDATGHEVEYYCYDRLEYPVRLDDDDFNPAKLGTRR